MADANVRLVFFPGQQLIVDARSNTRWNLGVIHVEDAATGTTLDHILAAGGPPKSFKDGNHTADPTPAGKYVLGAKEHHTTTAWPTSIIPFGAKLRVARHGTDWEAEYLSPSGKWTLATGPKSAVTVGLYNLAKARGKNVTFDDAVAISRTYFLDSKTSPPGLLLDTYMLNDFGEWAWRLYQNGQPTAFFVHTTTATELDTKAPLIFSHGCIHVLPRDRDRLMAKGYLRDTAGVAFEVRGYEKQDADLDAAMKAQIDAYLKRP